MPEVTRGEEVGFSKKKIIPSNGFFCLQRISYTLKWGPYLQMDSHLLRWVSLPPNEVGRIAQHVGEGEGRKEGKE